MHVLGPLDVLVDGASVPLGGPKQRALLAYLVLHRNEVVVAERLLDAIWPASDVAAATRSLRVYVSNLRKTLGPSAACLETRAGGYALVLDPGQVDADRCEQLAVEGRRARAEGDQARAAALFQEALALWRGPPLADLTYENFAQPEIGRLEELRLSIVEEQIESGLALGRHREVVAEIEALVELHPLRERLCGQLMLALYRSGRQRDALDAYARARRRLRDEFGLEPSRDLQDLEGAILRQDAGLAVEPTEVRARRHLPSPTTTLVGRRAEIDELRALVVGEGVRLVTLTGPGGVGKTRLGLQAAYELADRFTDGVFFIALAPVRDPGLVVSAIATALGAKQQAGRSLLETLQAHLSQRRLLLLIDNFEQVDEAAPVLADLLAVAGRVQMIVTSRARLGLYGEHEYRVPPPGPLDALALFEARARAVEHSFSLTPANRVVLSELCAQLDGLPLAIELAAARVDELSPSQMLADLPHSLGAIGPRDAPARHQTLRGTFSWSYVLLAPPAQVLLRRLAAFAGGCTGDAAVAVCDATRDDLTLLVRASLVRRTDPGTAHERFSMLETIRVFAGELLEQSDEYQAVRRRHAEYFLGLVEEMQPLRGTRHQAVEADHDNVRAALAFFVDANAPAMQLRLCNASWRYWYVRGLLSEGMAHVERALRSEAVELQPLRVDALRAAAVLAWAQGEFSRSVDLAKASLAIATQFGDEIAMARAFISIGVALHSQGDLAGAEAAHGQSRALAEKLGLDLELGAALANLGDVALMRGDTARARAHYGESLVLCRRADDAEGIAIAVQSLGIASLRDGLAGSAATFFADALDLFSQLQFTERVSACLTGLAAGVVADEPGEASRLLGAARALRERTSTPTEWWWEDEVLAATSASARAVLGDAAFTAEFERGRAAPEAALGGARARAT